MRITKSSVAALGLAAAMLLTSCSGDASGDPTTKPTTSGGSGTGTVTQGTAALTIAKPDGAIATESNNPWVGDSSALKLGYINAILEPVAFINTLNPSDPLEPWLAETVKWSDDYTSVALTARKGVKWNDGQEFTAKDIAFSYNLLKDFPELDTTALGIKDVKIEGDTVTLSFGSSMYVKQDKVLQRYVVPEHVWKDVKDPATATNLEPVGTGPYTLSKFTTQSVELTARTDYWGGPLAVPTLYYVSYNDNTALTTALASGDADWAQAFIPNVKSAYLDKDPKNVYWAPAGLGIDSMFVNTTKKPFNDVAFRKAVNMVIDRDQHAAIAREGGVPSLTSITGLPTPVGDAYISPEYTGATYKVDVEGAKAVLTEAGYTWDGDKLKDPSGEAVSFTLQVPQGWNDYVTGISLVAESVKALGVDAKVATPDADSWWEAKGTGDFDAIFHWTDTGATPYDFYSDQMDGRWLKKLGEPADFNFGRFDSAEATEALKAYSTATEEAARTAALATVQKIFVEQVPTMPIGTRPFIGEFNTRNYVGWPSDADPYANPDPTQPIAVRILTKLRVAS